MKQIILVIFLFTGYSAIAQKDKTKKLIIPKGHKIQVISTNTSEVDMGMGSQMKNNSTGTSILEVTSETDNAYALTTTVTKIKASIEAMGKTHEFDSEKQSDLDTEIGKGFSQIIGKPIAVSVNKFSGAVSVVKEISPEETDPMDGMMDALGGNGDDVTVNGAFIIIPPGKKSGESWTIADSTSVSKSSTIYTISSIANNNAVVSFTKTSTVNNSVDVQGSQMDVTVNSKSRGEATTDIITGLVSKVVVDTDIDGTMEIMGQSMPLAGKTNLVSTYTLIK